MDTKMASTSEAPVSTPLPTNPPAAPATASPASMRSPLRSALRRRSEDEAEGSTLSPSTRQSRKSSSFVLTEEQSAQVEARAAAQQLEKAARDLQAATPSLCRLLVGTVDAYDLEDLREAIEAAKEVRVDQDTVVHAERMGVLLSFRIGK